MLLLERMLHRASNEGKQLELAFKQSFPQNWHIFELSDFEKKIASLFQQTFPKNLNAERIRLNVCCFELSIKFVFYDSDKKPLAAEIIASFRLLYFHNEYYNNQSFLLLLISYMKL